MDNFNGLKLRAEMVQVKLKVMKNQWSFAYCANSHHSIFISAEKIYWIFSNFHINGTIIFDKTLLLFVMGNWQFSILTQPKQKKKRKNALIKLCTMHSYSHSHTISILAHGNHSCSLKLCTWKCCRSHVALILFYHRVSSSGSLVSLIAISQYSHF